MSAKPLGIKNYGSIAHLPGSRMGSGDHSCNEGQKRICNEKARDKHDRIIVQEKLDGSNVGICKVRGQILPLTRAGYNANTSPYEQHHKFAYWVTQNYARFDAMLHEGERCVGEWLLQAHGTRYELPHEPFVLFDIMRGTERALFEEVQSRARDFVLPKVVRIGEPMSIAEAMESLGKYGGHGALDPIEGAMWRVERNEISKKSTGVRIWRVDFLAKYVRPDKADGCYLESVTGKPTVWNSIKHNAEFSGERSESAGT
jgi:hypothetical protein